VTSTTTTGDGASAMYGVVVMRSTPCTSCGPNDDRPRPLGGATPIPLLGVDVLASVENSCSVVVVRQTFKNTIPASRDVLMEARYAFPIDPSSVVYAVRATVGSREVVARVEPLEKAEAAYRAAVRAGDTTGIVRSEARDVLSVMLGNIRPDEIVAVELRYACELRMSAEDGGGVAHRLVIPTAIAPRYSSGRSAPEGGSVSYDGNVGYRVRVDASVHHSRGVKRLWSPTHGGSMRVSTGADNAPNHIRMESREPLDRDVVVCIVAAAAAGSSPSCCVEWDRKRESIAAAIAVRGEAAAGRTAEAVPCDCVVLLDKSGSMLDDEKFTKATTAALQIITDLPPRSRFSIVAFSSDAVASHLSLVPVDAASIASVRSFLDGLGADGGTEMAKGLRMAYAIVTGTPTLFSEAHLPDLSWPTAPKQQQPQPQPSPAAVQPVAAATKERRLASVIVLTDGEIEDVDETLQLARTALASPSAVRTFSLGIGHAVRHAQLVGIARAGSGTSDVVVPTESIVGKANAIAAAAAAAPIEAFSAWIAATPDAWGRSWAPAIEAGGGPTALAPGFEKVAFVVHRRTPQSKPPRPQAGSGTMGAGSPSPDDRRVVVAASVKTDGRTIEYRAAVVLPPDGTAGATTCEMLPASGVRDTVVAGSSVGGDRPFDDGWLHVLAARNRIRDLEDGIATPARPTVDAEIEELGVTYGIVTRRTAFVFEDRGTPGQARGAGGRVYVDVPHALPKGEAGTASSYPPMPYSSPGRMRSLMASSASMSAPEVLLTAAAPRRSGLGSRKAARTSFSSPDEGAVVAILGARDSEGLWRAPPDDRVAVVYAELVARMGIPESALSAQARLLLATMATIFILESQFKQQWQVWTKSAEKAAAALKRVFLSMPAAEQKIILEKP
jgi:hypothetical protein